MKKHSENITCSKIIRNARKSIFGIFVFFYVGLRWLYSCVHSFCYLLVYSCIYVFMLRNRFIAFDLVTYMVIQFMFLFVSIQLFVYPSFHFSMYSIMYAFIYSTKCWSTVGGLFSPYVSIFVCVCVFCLTIIWCIGFYLGVIMCVFVYSIWISLYTRSWAFM